MPVGIDAIWWNALLILAGVLLLWLGSTTISRMRREATTTIVDQNEGDPLAPFLDAYRRGQMSEEEFHRIAEKVAPGRDTRFLFPRSSGVARPAAAQPPPPSTAPEGAPPPSDPSHETGSTESPGGA